MEICMPIIDFKALADQVGEAELDHRKSILDILMDDQKIWSENQTAFRDEARRRGIHLSTVSSDEFSLIEFDKNMYDFRDSSPAWYVLNHGDGTAHLWGCGVSDKGPGEDIVRTVVRLYVGTFRVDDSGKATIGDVTAIRKPQAGVEDMYRDIFSFGWRPSSVEDGAAA
jgi:hypothetical protein